jgi:hypothetical protein
MNMSLSMRELQRAKACTGPCGQTRPLTDFYHQKNGRDAKCKDCRKQHATIRKAAGRIPRQTSQAMQVAERIGIELHRVFQSWQGGEPHEWAADTGVVCVPRWSV